MGRGDRTANRQPQPQSIRLGAHKGLECFLPHFGRQSGTAIRNRQFAKPVIPPAGGDGDMAFGGANCDMASVAFKIRLRMTCCSCTRFPRTGRYGCSRWKSHFVCRARSSLRASAMVAVTASFRSIGSSFVSPLTINRRNCAMTPAARLSSWTISPRISLSSWVSGVSCRNSRAPASALASIDVSGWFSSWANAPDSSPSGVLRENGPARAFDRQFLLDAPTSPILNNQRRDRGRLEHHDSQRAQDLRAISLPCRRLIKSQLCAHRKPRGVDAPPAHLPPVEDELFDAPILNRNVGGLLAIEDPHRPAACLPSTSGESTGPPIGFARCRSRH